MAWCAQVTVAPELNNIAVFSSGTENGFNICIPLGGQRAPSSMAGAKLLWKNAQKKDIKKHISDTIKSIIPSFKPFLTRSVCNPWKVDSLTTSLHQTTKVRVNIASPATISHMKL